MKSIKYLVYFFFFVLFSGCTDTALMPKKLLPYSSSKKMNFANPSGQNSKIYIPGRLIWGGTKYNADFGMGGLLTISGPHPYPTDGTIPIFHVESTNLPPANAAVIDGPGINTFSESYVAPGDLNAPGNNSTIAVEVIAYYYDTKTGQSLGESYFTQFVDVEAASTQSGTVDVTFSGKIVRIDDDYYAVATSYQTPNGQVTQLGSAISTTSYTVSTLLIGTHDPNFNLQFFYSGDNSNTNWIPMPASLTASSDDVLYFKLLATNTSSAQQSPVDLSLNVQGDIYSGTSPLPIDPGMSYEVHSSTGKINSAGYLVKGSESAHVTTPPPAPIYCTVNVSGNMAAQLTTAVLFSSDGINFSALTPTTPLISGQCYTYKVVVTSPRGYLQDVAISVKGLAMHMFQSDYSGANYKAIGSCVAATANMALNITLDQSTTINP